MFLTRFLKHLFATIGYEPEPEDVAPNADVQMSLDVEREIDSNFIEINAYYHIN